MGAMRQLAYQSQWRAYCQRCEPNPPRSLFPNLATRPPPICFTHAYAQVALWYTRKRRNHIRTDVKS
jgi:hypothetical protein